MKGFVGGISCHKQRKTKKSQQNPSKDPLSIKFGSIKKRGVQDYLESVSKIDLLVRATKTEVN